jgi:hypothetical protein
MFEIIHTPEKGFGLFITTSIPAHCPIGTFLGKIMPLADAPPESVQIDHDRAISPDLQCKLRFLNHSCEPNCAFSLQDTFLTLYALRNIEKKEELTFDYNTTEFDLVKERCDFDCNCKSNNCLNRIKGFSHLDASQQDILQNISLPYIKKYYEECKK